MATASRRPARLGVMLDPLDDSIATRIVTGARMKSATERTSSTSARMRPTRRAMPL